MLTRERLDKQKKTTIMNWRDPIGNSLKLAQKDSRACLSRRSQKALQKNRAGIEYLRSIKNDQDTQSQEELAALVSKNKLRKSSLKYWKK